MTQTDTSVQEYGYFVDGTFKKSTSGKTVAINSPYQEGVMGYVQALSKDEVDAAIKSSHAVRGEWADTNIRNRGDLLNKWADELLANQEEISDTIMQEVGKTKKDAVKEVVRTAEFIRFTVEEAIHQRNQSLSGENYPGGSRNKVAIVERVPLGTILAISPFNYPVNLSMAKLAPALIAGNTVIFKPATQGAISAVKIVEAFAKVGFPAGVLQLVTGRGSEIGDYVVEHPGIDMISFTGGAEVGRRISKLAIMKPTVLELGGKDPAIISPKADVDKAVREILAGAFSYSGQRCTAIKRVLVDETIADEVVAKLQAKMADITVGMPYDNATVVPLIDSKSADFVQGLIDDAVKDGAKVLFGNKREKNLIYPTLIDNVTTDMRLAWEEPFGPVLPIIRVQNMEQAIKIANASEFGLQASVFSEDFNEAMFMARKIEAGSVQINGRTERGPDHFAFLGVKNSGLGTQGIANSIDSMTREKVFVVNITM
jgi:glyceraldehyde-3-phosphate dehydrogenase (NADP+)